MRRRSAILVILILLVAVGTLVGGLGLLVKYEPGFYGSGIGDEFADGPAASGVVTRVMDLQNDIRSKQDWGASFSASELNAALRENLDEGGWLARVLPAGFHAPRVAVEGNRVRIAGRYGQGFWSTVLSIELRAWLVKDEMNTVALELVSLRAGALPIGTQTWMDTIADRARESNVDITWYRRDGHPVGLCRFFADQPRPATQIRTVQIGDGKVTVAGRSLVGAGPPAGAPAPRPAGP